MSTVANVVEGPPASAAEADTRSGEAAMRLGMVKDTDIHRALERQSAFLYSGPEHTPLDTRLVTGYAPFCERAEALRSLRTQLMLRWFTDRDRTLAVVSPRRGDGSSLIAANLAIAFAELGERTLLIDANLRDPVQHKLFGIEPCEGLSDLLRGHGSLKQALTPARPFELLSVLSAGSSVPNPQELLARVTFAYLMETLPATFDVVIVDTPPALDCADAQIVAARAGGCMVVTRRHQTRVADLERTKTQLERSGALLLGAVISD